MASIIGAYQDILLLGQAPQATSLIPPAVVAVVLCLTSVHLYKRCAGEMVDEL